MIRELKASVPVPDVSLSPRVFSLSVFISLPFFPVCLPLSAPVSFTSLSPNCLLHSRILLCPVKHSKPLVTAF